jgi:hypothetical protein
LVMGRNLVPRPATGNTAVLMGLLDMLDGFVGDEEMIAEFTRV